MSDLNEKKVKERIQKLIQEIRYHSNLYYKHDAPEISDEAYDSLYNELVSLEQAFPHLKDPLSPTVRVGDKVLESFEKVKHRFPQWSFDNIFSWEELQEWEKKIKRFIEKEPSLKKEVLDYVVELKIDGLKVILDYENGFLVRGATRGDGKVGENITENIKTIRDIPLHIQEKKPLSVIGEVWIQKSSLEKINQEREKQELSPYANPRNLAAGTLRQLDTKIVAQRNLKMFAYDFDSEVLHLSTHDEELSFLQKNAFVVNSHYIRTGDIFEIQKYYESWIIQRHQQEYGIDGLVIKVNNKKIAQTLGYTAKAPRFAIAYKFPAEQKTTMVKDIILQVGRTGILTPVAVLEPVEIDGSMVSRATLHNEDEIQRLDVRIGDTVIVEKAGDIIPKIVSVLKNMRSEKSKPFRFETYLKKHHIKAQKEISPAGVVSWYLSDENDEVEIQKFSYFCSKKAMNIEGMSEQTIRTLYESGLIKTFSDIYHLKYDDVIALPLFKEKATQNLLDAIKKSHSVSFASFITALGIKHVGEEVAGLYADHFESPQRLAEASFDELFGIYGVGEKIAQSTVDWFKNKENLKEYKKLLSILNIQKKEKQSKKLSGKTFVITGTMKNYSRDELKKLIKKHGGNVSSSISSKTNYLIAGEKAGSKLKKAQELQIPIISENDFKKMLN